MTEPNVLGNVSPAKFIWENGNTEIINLWKGDSSSGGAADYTSLHHLSAGTTNGVAYQVPVNRVLYLLHFEADKNDAVNEVELQSNSSVDTNVGGTTQTKFFLSLNAGNSSPNNGWNFCIKFVAGEFVTPVLISGNDWFCTAWGVECDA